jgi:hypothetical protein
LKATLLTWNTNTLPDGRYRLKVEASDRLGNSIGEDLVGDAVSEPFSVDNTLPQVTSLSASIEKGQAVLAGAAADGEGWLQRLDVSVMYGRGVAVSPEGGFSDVATPLVPRRDCPRPARERICCRSVPWTPRATPPRRAVRTVRPEAALSADGVGRARRRWSPPRSRCCSRACSAGSEPSPTGGAELGRFQLLLLLAFAALRARTDAPCARWRELPGSGVFVVVVAFRAARAAVLPVVPDALGRHPHAYLWEGRVIGRGADPYRHAPRRSGAGSRSATTRPCSRM